MVRSAGGDAVISVGLWAGWPAKSKRGRARRPSCSGGPEILRFDRYYCQRRTVVGEGRETHLGKTSGFSTAVPLALQASSFKLQAWAWAPLCERLDAPPTTKSESLRPSPSPLAAPPPEAAVLGAAPLSALEPAPAPRAPRPVSLTFFETLSRQTEIVTGSSSPSSRTGFSTRSFRPFAGPLPGGNETGSGSGDVGMLQGAQLVYSSIFLWENLNGILEPVRACARLQGLICSSVRYFMHEVPNGGTHRLSETEAHSGSSCLQRSLLQGSYCKDSNSGVVTGQSMVTADRNNHATVL